MRVMVTGANGMLGIDVCTLLEQGGHSVIRTDVAARDEIKLPAWDPVDITNTHEVTQFVLNSQPDAVIHCAAATDVDACERHPDMAHRVNALGTWNLASVCGAHHITLAYVSTDFVFDGAKHEPYTEFDIPHPLNHYGASKLAGERLVAQLCRKHFIVRTAWLFGVHGKSFPSKMLEFAKTRNTLDVVCDQVGSPTHTMDLASTLIWLLESPLYGTYHVTSAGSCSWYELAQKTFELAGIQHVNVKPMPADLWPTPTKRPAYSVLRHYALELQGHDHLPPWQKALADFLARRSAQGS